jgi:type II secretory pathway component GspD/PulD (secretin)
MSFGLKKESPMLIRHFFLFNVFCFGWSLWGYAQTTPYQIPQQPYPQNTPYPRYQPYPPYQSPSPYVQASGTLQQGTQIKLALHQEPPPVNGTPTPVAPNTPSPMVPLAPVIAPQNPVAPPNVTETPVPFHSDEELVQLNFPNEIDLEVLVEYVSELLELKILFDEAIANKKIRIRTTGDIPVNSLMQVLQSALKMKDLTIVDAEVQGWKRIVPVAQIGTLAPQGNAQQILKDAGGATPVMQIFTLKHADVTQVQQLIQPFLTAQGGLCTPVKESRVLIISDYAANVIKAAELIKTLDVPKPTIQTEFLEVKNIDATALASQITTILQARNQVGGQATTTTRINITSDPRTNQLILTGTAEEIVTTKQLIKSLDVPTTLTTELYAFEYVDARDVDSLVKSMLDPLQEKLAYRSVINRNDNSLVISTTKEIHDQITMLGQRLNVPATQKQSPLRFYKLNNTTVDEVMTTLNALRQGTAFSPQQRDRDALRRTLPGSQEAFNHIGGAISLPLKPNEPLPPLVPDGKTDSPVVGAPQVEMSGGTESQSVGPVSMMAALLDTDVRVTADTKTNTIIVVAEPQIQEHYETLIKFLDRRSPQVLIEAKIVTVDTSNEFMLGVEISGGERLGLRKYFGFSSFGLSTPDPVTGALALIPGVGFNGTLVDPDTADVIVRALSLNSRAKVVASPRVLVNDNEEGRLQSVLSIPYMSLNSSQVVQSTSLGGNQDAGTTIVVTPHIGDSDQLQLEFAVEFSNFGSSSSNNLPPPRHVDQVSSVVTIPDGYTVIVGGLNRQNIETATQGIPILEKIPLVKYLGSQQSDKSTSTSLFVFLKPIILRDDKFKDLKYLSDGDIRSANIKANLPQSCPLVMQ